MWKLVSSFLVVTLIFNPENDAKKKPGVISTNRKTLPDT